MLGPSSVPSLAQAQLQLLWTTPLLFSIVLVVDWWYRAQLPFTTVLEAIARAFRQEEEIKGALVRNEAKLSLFVEDNIYKKIPKISPGNF